MQIYSHDSSIGRGYINFPNFMHSLIDPIFFSWLSDLIKQSHKQRALHLSDLYELPPSFESKTLTDKLESNWFNELKRSPENPSLIRATLRTIGWKPFLLGFVLLLTVRSAAVGHTFFKSLRFCLPGTTTCRSTLIADISLGIFPAVFDNACLASMATDSRH